MRWIISARQPFRFDTVVRSHGWAQLAPYSLSEEPLVLETVLRIGDGRAVVVSMVAAEGGVAVECAADLSEKDREQVAAAVRWMLGLDQDLGPFYERARREPKLAQAETLAKGRLLRSSSLFEDVVKVILTTNTAWGGTRRMNDALVAQLGTPAEDDPECHAFPTPEQIAATDEDTLRNETRLGYRSPYVLALARDVASGALDLEALKASDLPEDALRKELLAIKGVGPYAVAHLLMFLGRYGQVPVDSWALKLVSHEWHDGQPVKPKQVREHFATWGEWAGLAYWLWDWDWLQEQAGSTGN